LLLVHAVFSALLAGPHAKDYTSPLYSITILTLYNQSSPIKSSKEKTFTNLNIYFHLFRNSIFEAIGLGSIPSEENLRVSSHTNQTMNNVPYLGNI
jgi:hypothetical protein